MTATAWTKTDIARCDGVLNLVRCTIGRKLPSDRIHQILIRGIEDEIVCQVGRALSARRTAQYYHSRSDADMVERFESIARDHDRKCVRYAKLLIRVRTRGVPPHVATAMSEDAPSA